MSAKDFGDRVRTWRAKPVEIEAIQWTGEFEKLPPQWRSSGFVFLDSRGRLIVQTLDARIKPTVGDFIVRGTAGEYYAIRRPIFLGKYDEVAAS